MPSPASALMFEQRFKTDPQVLIVYLPDLPMLGTELLKQIQNATFEILGCKHVEQWINNTMNVCNVPPEVYGRFAIVWLPDVRALSSSDAKYKFTLPSEKEDVIWAALFKSTCSSDRRKTVISEIRKMQELHGHLIIGVDERDDANSALKRVVKSLPQGLCASLFVLQVGDRKLNYIHIEFCELVHPKWNGHAVSDYKKLSNDMPRLFAAIPKSFTQQTQPMVRVTRVLKHVHTEPYDANKSVHKEKQFEVYFTIDNKLVLMIELTNTDANLVWQTNANETWMRVIFDKHDMIKIARDAVTKRSAS